MSFNRERELQSTLAARPRRPPAVARLALRQASVEREA